MALTVETDVPGGVSRSPYGAQVPSGDVDLLPVFEEDVGLCHCDLVTDHHRGHVEVRQRGLGHACVLEEVVHLAEEFLNVDVAGLEHGGVVGVKSDPCARLVTYATGEPVVIGVDVGDEDRADVRDAPARLYRGPR